MDDLKFNINNQVKVRLTNFGKEIIRDTNDKMSRLLGEKVALYKVDEEGYTTFQMYQLMNIFGQYMNVGIVEVPFQLDIKITFDKI